VIQFVGPNDEPLTLHEWEALFEARADDMSMESWWRKRSIIDGVEVSTVWLGLPFTDSGLGIWETMIFGGAHDQWQVRHRNRQEAFDAHEDAIRMLRAEAAAKITNGDATG
jgi:hypothetical protein